MQAQGGGVIVNTGSYAATLASVGSAVYAATKAALVSLTRSMAAEWAPYGIRVNAFSPGVIPTRMTQPAIAAKGEAMLEEISLRRLGTTEEVARVALFLASSASSYLTGVNVEVTGGVCAVLLRIMEKLSFALGKFDLLVRADAGFSTPRSWLRSRVISKSIACASRWASRISTSRRSAG